MADSEQTRSKPWDFDTVIVSVWKIAFGFIGLFIGPTLLAVAYSLLMDWSATQAQGRREDKPL